MKDKYVVVNFFDDLEDGVEYPLNAIYPREGYEPSSERVASLASRHNAMGLPVIKKLIELPAKEIKEDRNNQSVDETITLDRETIKQKLDEAGIKYAKNAKTEILAEILVAHENEGE